MSRSRKIIAGCYILALTSSFSACDDSAGPSVRRAEDSVTLPPNCVPRPLRIVRDRSMNGPLRIHPANPRYFTDGDGKAILLVGSHTWSNLQDRGYAEPLPKFDYHMYLDFLEAHNHNFFRLWYQEQACWIHDEDRAVFWDPLPFKRTGPGKALDGKPKFDLAFFDDVFFERLRSRVALARERGIYVAVLLFNGSSVARSKGKETRANPWHGHPFHSMNNVNGVNGDLNGDDSGEETHELRVPAITAIQEKYVRKVIDTVNDLDNVLYEISNGSHGGSHQWQCYMTRLIKQYEATKPKQHPVGMSFEYPGGDNERLLTSLADWICPGAYVDDWMINTGKVVLDDTAYWFDSGTRIDRVWAWKRLMLGAHPLFMDEYHYVASGTPGGEKFQTTNPQWTSMRLNLGYIQTYANRVDLADMVPRRDLVSTGYCLANSQTAKAQFLVYIPQGNIVSVDLSGLPGVFVAEWFDPETGLTVCDSSREGGSKCMFHSPFEWESVLFLNRSSL
jgi:Family of unknown function (DUF6298)